MLFRSIVVEGFLAGVLHEHLDVTLVSIAQQKPPKLDFGDSTWHSNFGGSVNLLTHGIIRFVIVWNVPRLGLRNPNLDFLRSQTCDGRKSHHHDK